MQGDEGAGGITRGRAGLLIAVCRRTNSGQTSDKLTPCPTVCGGGGGGGWNSEPWVKNCIGQNVLSTLLSAPRWGQIKRSGEGEEDQ